MKSSEPDVELVPGSTLMPTTDMDNADIDEELLLEEKIHRENEKGLFNKEN
jgi:hypothetical protein